MKYLIGTRGSRLSLAQTRWVIGMLKDANPDCDYEIVTITTRGDTDSRPLFAIDQRGIFEKDVDLAVSDGRVHFAVHSMKDVPSGLPEGLVLASVPKREKVNDVLITPDGHSMESLPQGSVVGTSSLRRAVQVRRLRPDVQVRPIRGNVETRIGKIGNSFDGVVLAEAGIRRLGLNARYATLPVEDFSPSPGQGALALIARKGDDDTIRMLESIEDSDSRLAADAERALSTVVESGCRFPIGAYARPDGDVMIISVHAFSVDGNDSIVVDRRGQKTDPDKLGTEAGLEMQKRGVGDLALNWREKVEEWNTK